MTSNIQQRFDEFLKLHPEAYTEFCNRVEQLWNRGIRHYSSKAIIEIIRFHSAVDGRDTDAFKINNDFSALFARKWQADNIHRQDFFETRIRKAA